MTMPTTSADAKRLSSRALERADAFFFAPADGRSAAMLRIALAAMLAFAFWSAGGLLRPMPPLSKLPAAPWLFEHVFLTQGYAMLALGLIALFGAGCRPRASGLLLVVMLAPLTSLSRGQQSRQVLLLALLAFSMLRSDAQWSLRTWLGGTPRASAGPMWPIRLMQAQLTIVYAINALAKSTPQYLGGDLLVGMSRMRPNFLVNLSDGYLHVGALAVPAAWAAIASVVVEAFLAFAFWFPRLRWPAAVIGVVFHLGLQQIVKIFMLDYASMFLYMPFLLSWRTRVPEEGSDGQAYSGG